VKKSVEIDGEQKGEQNVRLQIMLVASWEYKETSDAVLHKGTIFNGNLMILN